MNQRLPNRRRPFQPRLEKLEDRTCPDAAGLANLNFTVGFAAEVASGFVTSPTEQQARQGTIQAVAQSAAAVLVHGTEAASSFRDMALDVGVIYEDPRAIAAKAALEGPEFARNVFNIVEAGGELLKNPNVVTVANFGAALAALSRSGVVSLYKDAYSFSVHFVEFWEALGNFKQALTSYMAVTGQSPDAVRNVNDMVSSAQQELKSDTLTYDETATRSLQGYGSFQVQSLTADAQALQQIAQFRQLNPDAAPVVDAIAAEITTRDQQAAGEYAATNVQAQLAAVTQIQQLEQIASEATTESIVNYNDAVLALDQTVAGLPPAVQSIVAQQVQGYQFALADGAAAQLSGVRDLVGSVEVANITFVSQLNSITVPLIGQANALSGVGGVSGGGGVVQPPQGGTVLGAYQGTYTFNDGPPQPMTLVFTGSTPNPTIPGTLFLSGSVTLQNLAGQTYTRNFTNVLFDPATGSLSGGPDDNSFTFGSGAALTGNTASGPYVFVSPTLGGRGTFNVSK